MEYKYKPSKFLLFIVIAALSPSVLGQKLAELDYLIRFAGPITVVQEKYIHDALQNHEAGLGVWVDRPYMQVKVRTHVALSATELQSVWQPQGLIITFLGPLHSASDRVNGQELNADERMPVFINTGDAEADNAAYELAKSAWIAAHPDEYERVQRADHPE